MRTIPFFLGIIFSIPILLTGQIDTCKTYIFGHSLIDHRPPAIPTPSDETTVAHWLYLMAKHAGHNFAAAGQYGFLPSHRRLPPQSQWGYDMVPGAWDEDNETFAEADIDKVLITALNYIQWQEPDQPYPGEGPVTPISATVDIVDWLESQEPGIRIYIYENWPDMAGYLANGFPPTRDEWDEYHNYLYNDFNSWWIDYHDAVHDARPDAEVKMIPVGICVASALNMDALKQIPYEEWYEDDAPHGRASVYFLASMATYMAFFEEKTPENYVIPNIIHPQIRTSYLSIREEMWRILKAYKFSNGDSRVFFDLSTNLDENLTSKNIEILPNPFTRNIQLTNDQDIQQFEILDITGRSIISGNYTGQPIDLSSLNPGIYMIVVRYRDGKVLHSEIVKSH